MACSPTTSGHKQERQMRCVLHLHVDVLDRDALTRQTRALLIGEGVIPPDSLRPIGVLEALRAHVDPKAAPAGTFLAGVSADIDGRPAPGTVMGLALLPREYLLLKRLLTEHVTDTVNTESAAIAGDLLTKLARGVPTGSEMLGVGASYA